MTDFPPPALSDELPGEEAIQKWVKESRAGSEEAFAQIVGMFVSRLQGLIYRILLDWDETRDVAQETFIHAYRALPRYRPTGKFQSWLFQIAVRTALDALRKRKRRPVSIAQESPGVLEEKGVADPTVVRNETISAIEKAVQALPSEQRSAFVLAEYEGCSHAEIAAMIGGSTKSVEMHLYRARQNLREKLKTYL